MSDAASRHPSARWRAEALVAFAVALLQRAGLDAEMAQDVGAVLVEADLLGHPAGGLRLLAPYLADLEAGRAARAGAPRVFNQRAASALWDGQGLPGAWLVRRAIGWCAPRAVQYGCAGIVIRHSHRVGCPLAYLEPVARAGLLIRIAWHDRRAADAAAACGPVAIGMPALDEPLLVELGGALASPGAQGQPDAKRDWALALAALTAGLAGRSDDEPPPGAGTALSIQIHDPAAFGGLDAFQQAIGQAARAPGADARAVRPQAAAPAGLPGTQALARKREQLARGVVPDGEALDALAPWARRLGVPLPGEPTDPA